MWCRSSRLQFKNLQGAYVFENSEENWVNKVAGIHNSYEVIHDSITV
jgi:hypothetical protein